MWDDKIKDYTRKRNMDVEEVKPSLLGKIPTGPFCEEEDVAKLAVLLASPASDYMTGQSISLTSGQVMI